MKCEAVTCKYNKLQAFNYGYCQLENPKINEENTKCSSFKERESVNPIKLTF